MASISDRHDLVCSQYNNRLNLSLVFCMESDESRYSVGRRGAYHRLRQGPSPNPAVSGTAHSNESVRMKRCSCFSMSDPFVHSRWHWALSSTVLPCRIILDVWTNFACRSCSRKRYRCSQAVSALLTEHFPAATSILNVYFSAWLAYSQHLLGYMKTISTNLSSLCLVSE